MATPPTPARLAKLTQTACKIFSTVYNPTAARSGNKILRERLVGPTVSSYYPQPLIHFRDIKAAFPQLNLIDTDEKERLDEIARRKRRGKGAPKKGNVTYTIWSQYYEVTAFTKDFFYDQDKAKELRSRRNKTTMYRL
jgi:small subunit ribosomal protein S33